MGVAHLGERLMELIESFDGIAVASISLYQSYSDEYRYMSAGASRDTLRYE